MDMKKKVGLFGLTFDSGNMGCQALAYSFSYLLNTTVHEDVIAYVFSGEEEKFPDDLKSKIEFKHVPFSFKNAGSILGMIKILRKCDIVFDFTDGDSFSDIYGLKRFFRVSVTKVLAILLKKPLVLGPQTYGPYSSAASKKVATFILKRCYYVCSRDALSAQLVEIMANRKVDVFTDIAFSLPFEKSSLNSERRKVGINVSGLLWNGGYTEDNQFGLKTDYRKYIISLIKELYSMNYEIHLIPHVITKNINNCENDVIPNNEIKKMFPEVICAPLFTNPIQAKNYLSAMDIFMGARMHATIGAFSSETITIPFSYSKKFEGLYNSIGYPYVISAAGTDTEEALEETINYFKDLDVLNDAQKKAMEIVRIQIEQFKRKLNELMR